MTRYACGPAAFEIDSLPSQCQVAICHGFFVAPEARGMGHAHLAKQEQAEILKGLAYDYAICTCDGANAKQQAVLERAGWRKIDTFHNTKTGAETQVWGRRVCEISPCKNN